MTVPHFTRTIIGELVNESPEAGPMNTFLNVGDINGDGRPDIVLSGRNGRMAWFENDGSDRWQRHDVGAADHLECGGLVYDLTGNGHGDIIDGGDWRSDELAWWENPGQSDREWTRRLITKTGYGQFHDEIIGDVTGDGIQSLVFWNQGSATLFRVTLPKDPRVSPWPGIETIAAGVREDGNAEEGLTLADVDGDGMAEIIAGTHWYQWTEDGWEGNKFASGYITTVIAAGDLDRDGQIEIVLAEGDACISGKPQGGKVAWFKPGRDIRSLWDEHVLAEGLLDPHSLQIGDLCGQGHLDLLVGEIGLADQKHPPRLFVFENDGRGGWTRHLLDEGIGTHHARLTDLRGRGRLDIVSRPLHGPDKWRLFVWERA